MPLATQLSIFGVEARPPSPLDLEGLLAGPGQVVRMGGTARVSVVVDAAWRARVLLAECAQRGIAATVERATVEGHFGFRTAYVAPLAPLGAAWLRGAVKHPPPGFVLDGRRLRFWVAAAGAPDGADGYALRLGAGDEPAWAAVGAALAAAGLAAELLGPRAGGPAYRIVGRRRLARLAELVGDPPPAADPAAWPRPDPARRRPAAGTPAPAGETTPAAETREDGGDGSGSDPGDSPGTGPGTGPGGGSGAAGSAAPAGAAPQPAGGPAPRRRVGGHRREPAPAGPAQPTLDLPVEPGPDAAHGGSAGPAPQE